MVQCFTEGLHVVQCFTEGLHVVQCFTDGLHVVQCFTDGLHVVQCFTEGLHVVQSFTEGLHVVQCFTRVQTCQVTRILRESHAFQVFLTLTAWYLKSPAFFCEPLVNRGQVPVVLHFLLLLTSHL